MNEIGCSIRVTLVPLDSTKASRGPFTCGSFRAFPEQFYGYPDASETGDPITVDMHGTPYCAIAELTPAPAPEHVRWSVGTKPTVPFEQSSGSGLDVYEEALAEALKPLPHRQVTSCKDGTVAAFVGPHALTFATLFLAAIRDEGLT